MNQGYFSPYGAHSAPASWLASRGYNPPALPAPSASVAGLPDPLAGYVPVPGNAARVGDVTLTTNPGGAVVVSNMPSTAAVLAATAVGMALSGGTGALIAYLIWHTRRAALVGAGVGLAAPWVASWLAEVRR
jgi:hypothetical protein